METEQVKKNQEASGKNFQPLLYSAALHCTAVFIFLGLYESPHRAPELAKKHYTVEIVEPPNGVLKKVLSHPKRKQQKNKNQTQSSKPMEPPNLGTLPGTPPGIGSANVRSKNGQTFNKNTGPETEKEPEVFFGLDGYEIARRMGVESASLLTPFLNAIHERIANNLKYPEELIEGGRIGKVSFQFEIDRSGRMVEGFFHVDTEDNFLKVIAMRAVRRGLDGPLDRTLHSKKERLRIVAAFEFFITYREANLPPKGPDVNKNTMNFRKVAIRNTSVLSMRNDPNTGAPITEINPIHIFSRIFKKGNQSRYTRSIST